MYGAAAWSGGGLGPEASCFALRAAELSTVRGQNRVECSDAE